MRVDPGGEVVVDPKTIQHPRRQGTSVTVPLPADLDLDPARWALGAALVNPHATISVDNLGYDGEDSEDSDSILYKSAGQDWSKWTPSKPASRTGTTRTHSRPWSTHTSIKPVPAARTCRLASSSPNSTGCRAAPNRSASGRSRLVSPACRSSPAATETIKALHAAMCSAAKSTPPSRLGPVDPEHYRAMLDAEYGVHRGRFWHATTKTVVGGVPWIIEVAVAGTVIPGRTHFAVNHGPAFGDPLGRTNLLIGDRYQVGAASTLICRPRRPNQAAVLHVICAATQFVDKGKVALVVPREVADVAAKALSTATKTLQREAELRRKDARKAERAAQRAERIDRCDIKDAVFEVLPDAKEAAGDIVAARTLFYQVRPRIQNLTDAKLDYRYFSQILLPEYERTVGPLAGLFYEARGEIHHPHDGQVIRLGTREVEAYIRPTWQFDKILYVEKMGLAAQLAPYQLGQRYDMAIIFGQGYAATACRDLLARSDIRDMKIFVLHDADIGGYNIARTLGRPPGGCLTIRSMLSTSD